MAYRDDGSGKVFEMIEAIGIGMLVTAKEGGGALRARPMAAHPRHGEGAVYFLADAQGRKDEEIFEDPNVCLAFADPRGERYVSVTGTAAVSNDRAKIRELWSMAAKAWWDGPDDPAIRLVRVAPSEAEYWEGPGRAVTAVKMAAAAVTGGRPDLGDNEKVPMGRH